MFSASFCFLLKDIKLGNASTRSLPFYASNSPISVCAGLLMSRNRANGPPRSPWPGPYGDIGQQAAPVVGADGDETGAGGGSIVCPQEDLFSPGQIHGACLPFSHRGDSRIARFCRVYHSFGEGNRRLPVSLTTKHDCSIYDADIAKNYDRVSPLAQIQRPREAIKI